jgi:spermidine/putrescine transport system substrate-binding protein
MKRITLLLLASLIFSCSSENKNTLYIFSWSGFFKPELISKFEKTNNCRVVIDTYDSNESMYAKLKIGSSRYDLILPSNYYLEILHEQGLILPLEKSKLTIISGLDRNYFKDEDPLLGLPIIVGFSGITYRKDRIPDLEASYGVFGRKDLRGRMTMLNDLREALGAALRYNGHSINTTNPDEIDQAANLVIKWKKNLAKFENEQYKNGLATAEFLVSQGYSIDVLQLQREDESVDFLFPKEGGILAVDYLALSKDSKNLDLAYAFMNFILEPSVAAENMMFINTLIPVQPAYKLLSEKMRNNPILFPSDEILQKLELIEDLHEDVILYYKAWERVKGA